MNALARPPTAASAPQCGHGAPRHVQTREVAADTLVSSTIAARFPLSEAQPLAQPCSAPHPTHSRLMSGGQDCVSCACNAPLQSAVGSTGSCERWSKAK